MHMYRVCKFHIPCRLFVNKSTIRWCCPVVSLMVLSCEERTCVVCAWAVLSDSAMLPVYPLPLGTVYISDVLPAGEAPSQGLEDTWEVSEGYPTQIWGW